MLLDSVNWIALDIQTMGLDPELDAVVEVAALRFRGESEVGRFVTFARPNIAMQAPKPHGIMNAAAAHAPKWDTVLVGLRNFISDDSLVVGHHVWFGRAFLRGIPDEAFVDSGPAIMNRWLCTRTLARLLVPDYTDHGLYSLRRHCGLDVPSAVETRRRAHDGALVVAALFRHLVALHENRMPESARTVRRVVAAAQDSIN